MARRRFKLSPFLGLVTSLDPREIPQTAASDLLNVHVEGDQLRPRYGYRNLTSPVTNFNGPVRMFNYHQGYNLSAPYGELEEFLSVEKANSLSRLFTTNPSTGTKAEVKNGTTVVSLDDSEWRSVTWQDSAYVFNANNSAPMYRHKIGDATSMVSLNPPTAPGALGYTIYYGGGGVPYNTVSWAGLNMSTGVTYVGNAQASGSVNNTTTIGIAHGVGSVLTTPTSFEVDMSTTSAGNRDYTYNDILVIDVTGVAGSPIALQNATVALTLTNASGTAITPTLTTVGDLNGAQGLYRGAFKFQFDNKTRADWSAIKKIKVEYKLAGVSRVSTTQNVLTFNIWLGGVPIVPSPDPFNMLFSASYLASTTGQESGLSPELAIPTASLTGYNPVQALFPNFSGCGVWLQVNVPSTADGTVDHYRLYADTLAGGHYTHYLFADQSGGGTPRSFNYRQTWPETVLGTTYQPSPFYFSNVMCAGVHKGFMTWGYQGVSQTSNQNGDVQRVNIRMSRIGDPEKMHSDNDDTNDIRRGADFVLADDADEPQAIHSAGDALIVLGKRGCHASVGQYPSAMTPFKKLPQSRGVANPMASCRWKDASGNWGVAYLDRWGSLWLAVVDTSFNDSGGYRIEELSAEIRGTLWSFLVTGQSLTDLSTARVAANEADDSLWIICGTRAAVLRRPSLLNNQRQWTLHSYTVASSATIPYVAFSNKWRIRWLRSTGYMDEVEYNSSTNAYITGATRDAGQAMPTPYWQSRTFTVGANTRIDSVQVLRDDLTNTPTVTITSTYGGSSSRTLASGSHNTRFGFRQQGWEHTLKVALGQNDSAYRAIQVDMLGPISRRALE